MRRDLVWEVTHGIMEAKKCLLHASENKKADISVGCKTPEPGCREVRRYWYNSQVPISEPGRQEGIGT